MPLLVQPLQLADFDTLIHHADVGEPGDDLVAPPCPVSWPVRTRSEAQLRAHCHFTWQRRRFLEDPSVRYIKVVDTSNGSANDGNGEEDNIIAVARWHFYPQGYDYESEKHWEMAPTEFLPNNSDDDDDDDDAAAISGTKSDAAAKKALVAAAYPPPNFNIALHNHILGTRDRFRAHWIPTQGKGPVWLLMHCVTRPSQRRRGAAAMLVRWGQEQAQTQLQRDGGGNGPVADAYLEAGAMGAPVYEKCGFVDISRPEVVDVRGFEGSPVQEFIIRNMQWSPQQGVRKLLLLGCNGIGDDLA